MGTIRVLTMISFINHQSTFFSYLGEIIYFREFKDNHSMIFNSFCSKKSIPKVKLLSFFSFLVSRMYIATSGKGSMSNMFELEWMTSSQNYHRNNLHYVKK